MAKEPMTPITLQPGTELRTRPRAMTRERMRWYVDAQPTIAADDGRIHTQPPTIHDDDDYARAQGLPGIIADGMISTNWIQGLLVDVFGPQFACRSRLKTKYIAPIYENQVVTACARVQTVTQNENGDTVYTLEVWCEDDSEKKLTVGSAMVQLPA
ncbi:MaoC family dehydratase [Chelativorans sp. AA-79]|uniref:MaoC family dehydratase n=1 Tax=Chelativorans sp. AA-79 TaxID=3028735 RepID=UPI0023F688CA|nr:MaoC family dehydratase [Chelativorans sp. AA-79]WEX09043.1 MaoC family dehydratase [Chelativorans sp. AA-79]